MRPLNKLLVGASALLVILVPKPSSAGTNVTVQQQENHIDVGIRAQESEGSRAGGIVPVVSNPPSDCVYLAGLTGEQAGDRVGATGQNRGVITIDMITSDDTFTFVSCRLPEPRWFIWIDGTPPPQPFVNALLQQALSRVQLPLHPPETSPPGTPERPLITQLETWYWAPTPQTVAATASLADIGGPANISITATATPHHLTFTPGDDSPTLTCSDPQPWKPGATRTNCSHTYTTKGTTTLELSTTYNLSVTCTPTVMCHQLNPPTTITTTTQRELTIHEIRPVITN